MSDNISDIEKDEELSPQERIDNALTDATEQLANLQNLIDNPLPAKGLHPTPSGGPAQVLRTPEMVEEEKRNLRIRQKNLIKDASGKMDKILKDAPLEVKVQSYKKIYEWEKINKTPAIENSDNHLRNGKPEKSDDISRAQGPMMEMLSEQKNKVPTPTPPLQDSKSAPEPVTPEAVSPNAIEAKTKSILNEYSLNISFTTLDSRSDKGLNDPNKTPGKDAVDE